MSTIQDHSFPSECHCWIRLYNARHVNEGGNLLYSSGKTIRHNMILTCLLCHTGRMLIFRFIERISLVFKINFNPRSPKQTHRVKMEEKMIVSLSIFLLLLLLGKNGMASPRAKDREALRRYREVRDLDGIVFPIISSCEQRRQNQNTFTLNGKRKSVKKERQSNHETIETKDVARRKSSPTNGRKDDTRGSDYPSENKREPFSLDASKRQALREYHRLGLHLR